MEKLYIFFIIGLLMLYGCAGLFEKVDYYPRIISIDDVDYYSTNDYTTIKIDKPLEQYVFKYSSSTQSSVSMQPLMGGGNLIYVETLKPTDTVNVGDIVSCITHDDGSGVIHQVVRIKGDCYYTRGINNIQEDGCIKRENITERVVAIVFTNNAGYS